MELSSYYLYLTTLLSNDTIGQRKVAEELSKSFMKHPDSWKILCMLVEVDSEYKIYSERLGLWKNSFMMKSRIASGSIYRRLNVTGKRVLL
mgnify:CR=1 FL=1